EGFALLVKEGARVSQGQALVQFDLDRIARQCKSLVSLIILTNSDRFALTPLAVKTVKAGEPLMQLAPRSATAAQTVVDNSSAEASASVRITHRGGLHA
ncbi:PTS glucose transporter subunit IIA, partial [Vibrio cholerae]|uniref:PTS glucose transporter subunit IIA n=1 Tax=Vibrio cholerae TaxID=666 RepID=UPI001BCE8C8E